MTENVSRWNIVPADRIEALEAENERLRAENSALLLELQGWQRRAVEAKIALAALTPKD